MVWEDAIVIGLALSGFAFFFMASKFEKVHYPMQILFLFLGIFSFLIVADTTSKIATIQNQTNISNNTAQIYTAYMWGLVLTLAYYILGFLWAHIKKFRAAAYGSKEAEA